MNANIKQIVRDRRSSPTIISDVVHEGTHVIDYVNGMDQNVLFSWTGEIRAFPEENVSKCDFDISRKII